MVEDLPSIGFRPQKHLLYLVALSFVVALSGLTLGEYSGELTAYVLITPFPGWLHAFTVLACITGVSEGRKFTFWLIAGLLSCCAGILGGLLWESVPLPQLSEPVEVAIAFGAVGTVGAAAYYLLFTTLLSFKFSLVTLCLVAAGSTLCVVPLLVSGALHDGDLVLSRDRLFFLEPLLWWWGFSLALCARPFNQP